MSAVKERWWTVRRDGWYRGIVFTTDPRTGKDTIVYETGLWQKQKDAAHDLLLWLHYNRGHKHPDGEPTVTTAGKKKKRR